jgi:hypothetical protein
MYDFDPQLTGYELRTLRAISARYPYRFDSIKYLWLRLPLEQRTAANIERILTFASSQALSLGVILEAMENGKG